MPARGSRHGSTVDLTFGEYLTHYFPPILTLVPAAVMLWMLLISDAVLVRRGPAWAIAAVSLALSSLFFWIQTRALRFISIATNRTAESNYAYALNALADAGWNVVHKSRNRRIVSSVAGFPRTMRSWGERVELRFKGNLVLVNSICDPERRPALTAWGRNRDNVRRVIQMFAGI
jgi:hypothetical protein